MSFLVTSFLFLFIIDSAGGTSTTDESICNIKWVNISNVQYAVTNKSHTMSYSTAVTCCRSLNMRLTVLDKEVNGFQVMRAVVGIFPGTEFWVDARRNATTYMFTWPDGSPVNESLWNSNEPQYTDNCARVHSDGTLWGIDCLNRFYSAFCQIYSAKTLVTATSSCESGGRNQTATLLSSPNEISPTTDQTSALSSSRSRQSTTVLQTNQTTVSSSLLPRQSTTLTQTFPTKMLTTSSTPILCACTCRHHFNLNDTKIEGKLKQIQEALSVNTTALSSSVRKKSSSNDSRKSAQAVGLIGICILVCCGTIIFIIDVMKIFQACK